MVTDELGRQLHDRATRHGVLSAEERRRLEEWYAEQDRAELEMFQRNWAKKQDDMSIESLRSQIDVALAQIVKTTQRIQKISAENEVLRREISSLQRQLTQHSTAQAA